MSTILEEPATQTSAETIPAERLRRTMAAIKLSFAWFGTVRLMYPV